MLVLLTHTLWMSQGLPALYRGIGPTLLGIVPYGGLAFLTFESLKQVGCAASLSL